MFVRGRLAEQIGVHLLVEHDGAHRRKHRQEVQLPLALALLHEQLQQVRQVAVAQLAVVSVQRLVVYGADLGLVLIAPAVQQAGDVLPHLGLHIDHPLIHLGWVSGVRGEGLVYIAADGLEFDLSEGHAELIGGLDQPPHESRHVHRRRQWGDAIGPVHEVDGPEPRRLLGRIPFKAEVVWDGDRLLLFRHNPPPLSSEVELQRDALPTW